MAKNFSKRGGTPITPGVTNGSGGNVLIKGQNAKTHQAMMKTQDLRGGSRSAITQMAAASVVRTAPKVYSPLYEMSNLMLPRDLRTMNTWNRHFHNTNPVVRNAVNLHATYPISKFNITCRDPKVKNFFIDQCDHIDLIGLLLSVSLEFWKLGEVFPYAELDEDKGWWDYVFCHNPDYVRVKTNTLTREPIITLIPDDALRRLAMTQNAADRALKEQLPDEIIYHLQRGEDIPLPNFNVTHLKMLSSDYDIRGSSIIMSVYKDLMLYDKIREAKYSQADNFINPITLVKLGDPTGAWKPNDQDIINFRNAWMESQYDPDAKLITHGAVDVQKVSNAGQTLDVAQDIELIMKNLYTGLMVPEAIINGEGPNYCLGDVGRTEVLTNKGYQVLDQIVEYDHESSEIHVNLMKELKDKDLKIACFNPNTECLEYHAPKAAQVFNYDSDVDGKMVEFHTKKIDLSVTPNHKMWVDCRKSDSGWKNEWHLERADKVNARIRRFRSKVSWIGEDPASTINVAGSEIDFEDYLRFVGYFVTEGYTGVYGKEKSYQSGNSYRVGIAQSEIRQGTSVSSSFATMKETMYKLPFDIKTSFDKNGQKEFLIYDRDLTLYMREMFGTYSHNKHLTPELKKLSTKYLRILLDSVVLGDGHESDSCSYTRRGKNKIGQYQFFSTSKRLADDIYEIVFKLGYVPIMRLEKRSEKNEKYHDIYWVEWTDSEIGNFPTLDTRSKQYPNGAISRKTYKDKVFCFTVPYNLFVVRKNGKTSIQGNSTASIGLEVLRARYERFRNLITRWVKKKLFEPISKVQDFYEYKDGEKKLVVPDVQWNKINLRDIDSYINALTQLMSEDIGKSRVSQRTVFSFLDIDLDTEDQNLKEEAIQQLKRQKEIERLSKMTSEELATVDPTKPVEDLHPGEPVPGTAEEGEGLEAEIGAPPAPGGGLGGGVPELGDLGGEVGEGAAGEVGEGAAGEVGGGEAGA